MPSPSWNALVAVDRTFQSHRDRLTSEMRRRSARGGPGGDAVAAMSGRRPRPQLRRSGAAAQVSICRHGWRTTTGAVHRAAGASVPAAKHPS